MDPDDGTKTLRRFTFCVFLEVVTLQLVTICCLSTTIVCPAHAGDDNDASCPWPSPIESTAPP